MTTVATPGVKPMGATKLFLYGRSVKVFAQNVNKRVGVTVSEPGAVATGQMFNCRN
jgi:NADP-dependent 3-hydroxy acid dehydrogenase YdfG